MYLLHSHSIKETIELERKLRTELALLAKDSLRKLQAEKLAQSDPFAEPSTSANLGPVTRTMLLEYKGKAGIYQVTHYGRELDSSTKMQIGRAMVLTGREFGKLDEIVLNLFRATFQKHQRADRLSYSSPSTAVPNFDYSYLERVFKDYLRPGLSHAHPYELKWRSALGAVHLELGELNGKLYWSLRGPSRLRGAHRAVLAELNRALDDYAQRLEWMARYRHSEPKPGLGTNAIAAVRAELKNFYGRPLDLSGLEPGVSFGDDPVVLSTDSGETRAFFSRCELCELPAAVEIRTSYSSLSADFDEKVDWSSSRDTFSSSFPENTVNRLLQRNHKQSGCSHHSAKSIRTGERLPLAEL